MFQPSPNRIKPLGLGHGPGLDNKYLFSIIRYLSVKTHLRISLHMMIGCFLPVWCPLRPRIPGQGDRARCLMTEWPGTGEPPVCGPGHYRWSHQTLEQTPDWHLDTEMRERRAECSGKCDGWWFPEILRTKYHRLLCTAQSRVDCWIVLAASRVCGHLFYPWTSCLLAWHASMNVCGPCLAPALAHSSAGFASPGPATCHLPTWLSWSLKHNGPLWNFSVSLNSHI